MPQLSTDETLTRLHQGQNIVLYEQHSADLDTPVMAYLKIKDHYAQSLLYESVEKSKGRSRYSIIACDPDIIWRCENSKATRTKYDVTGQEIKSDLCNDVVDSLRDLHKDCKVDIPSVLPSAASGLFGYFTYDMVRFFEELPEAKQDNINIPDAIMWRPRTIIIFDNVYDTIYNVHTLYQDVLTDYDKAYQDALKHFDHIWTLLRRPIAADSLSIARHIDPITPVAHMEKQDYMQSVSTAIDYIYAGDAFQIVPSQRFHIDYTKDPFAFYRILRRVNPSPYMFYAECDDFILAGASPEILVRTEDRKVTIRPIAGTRPRGKNTQEDNELEQDLLNDPKECAEHLMLLDLGRNDVGRVSKIGSVDVTEEFIIERYSHVMHIVSNVEGILKEDYDFLDAIFTALPAGTVSGAPKIRAMEIINELEPEKRSFYAGGIGYFSGNGDGDFALMLRTGLIKDQKLYIQAGAGVVADSVPEKEYTETVNKAGALIKAAAIALSQI